MRGSVWSLLRDLSPRNEEGYIHKTPRFAPPKVPILSKRTVKGSICWHATRSFSRISWSIEDVSVDETTFNGSKTFCVGSINGYNRFACGGHRKRPGSRNSVRAFVSSSHALSLPSGGTIQTVKWWNSEGAGRSSSFGGVSAMVSAEDCDEYLTRFVVITGSTNNRLDDEWVGRDMTRRGRKVRVDINKTCMLLCTFSTRQSLLSSSFHVVSLSHHTERRRRKVFVTAQQFFVGNREIRSYSHSVNRCDQNPFWNKCKFLYCALLLRLPSDWTKNKE